MYFSSTLLTLTSFLFISCSYQVYVDQITADVVAVTRHCPITHQSVILVAHTAFGHPSGHCGEIKPLVLDGLVDKVILETYLTHNSYQNGEGERYVAPNNHQPHPTRVSGCDDYVCHLKQNIPIGESRMLTQSLDSPSQGKITIHFRDFLPGSVVAIRLKLTPKSQMAVARLRTISFNDDKLQQALKAITLSDLNVALYRCDREEVEDERPGVYDIPGWGPLKYCGLQGVMSLLGDIRPNNDLGHPLCDNLRAGDWLSGIQFC